MAKKNELKKQYALSRRFWIIAVVVVVAVIGSLGWFLVWRTGWPDYVQAVSKCNGHPPIIADTFMSDSVYTKPGDKSYKIPARPGAVGSTYYCSERDAGVAGYKHET